MHWGLLSDRSDALSFACLVRNFYICMTAFVGNISSSPSYIGDLLLPSFRVIIFYHHIWLQSRFLSCSCWMTMRAPSTSRCWWNHVPGAGGHQPQVQVPEWWHRLDSDRHCAKGKPFLNDRSTSHWCIRIRCAWDPTTVMTCGSQVPRDQQKEEQE